MCSSRTKHACHPRIPAPTPIQGCHHSGTSLWWKTLTALHPSPSVFSLHYPVVPAHGTISLASSSNIWLNALCRPSPVAYASPLLQLLPVSAHSCSTFLASSLWVLLFQTSKCGKATGPSPQTFSFILPGNLIHSHDFTTTDTQQLSNFHLQSSPSVSSRLAACLAAYLACPLRSLNMSRTWSKMPIPISSSPNLPISVNVVTIHPSGYWNSISFHNHSIHKPCHLHLHNIFRTVPLPTTSSFQVCISCRVLVPDTSHSPLFTLHAAARTIFLMQKLGHDKISK